MRNRHILMTALLCAVLHCLPFGVVQTAHAEQPRIVRVGVYPLTQYNRIENGKVSGYNADYLDQIVRYTGWKLVYVILENWKACTDALQAGRVDITAPSLYTPDRALRYIYCSYPSGTSYTALVTLKSSPVAYEDFDNIARMRVGVTDNTLWLKDFMEFARQRHMTMPELVKFPDVQSARAALRAGVIDATLNGVIGLQDDEKVLAKCNPVPFYYIAMPHNLALMREFDNAAAQLKMELPDLEYQLSRTYLSRNFQTPLSKAEHNFIAQCPVLRVGYSPDRKPYSWTDPVTQKARGILPDILRDTAQRSGLRFTFVPLGDNSRKLSDYFAANDIDLATDIFFSSTLPPSSPYRLSTPLARSNVYLYTAQNRQFTDNTQFTLATSANWRCGKKYAAKAFPLARIVTFPDAEASLTAVVRGEADAVMDSAQAINYLTNKPRFGSITQSQDFSGFEESRLAFNEGLPAILTVIINNMLLSLDDKSRNQIIADNIAAASPPLTVADIIYEYRSLLLLSAEMLLFFSVLTAYALYLRRKSLYRAQANDLRLAHIADTINGGVISITPQLPLSFLDANNGFWQLLGYKPDKPGIDSLMELLHEDDTEKLLQCIATSRNDNAALSLELRLRKRDGDWLPLLLRGTPSADANGNPALDCVVMDITEQKYMQEELEQEKERYRIILEQSQDIIFDVDTEKHQFQCSPNFLLKFGREATPLFNPNGRPNNRHIVHPDDLPALTEMRRRVREGKPTVFAVMRIPTAEGRYIWCRVQTTRISKSGVPLRLVGKIVDIDDEVRRRVELERRSQRDSLTDLLNKTAFKEQVSACMPSRPERDKVDALLFLDLDNFKLLNDTFGHVRGDAALAEAAEILKRVFRNADAVGRFGGDEFCIFTKNITRSALHDRAEALLDGLNMLFEGDGQKVEISASLGIYIIDGTEPSYETALQRADTAQYHAKQAGKNCFRFYDEVADVWNEFSDAAPQHRQQTGNSDQASDK